MRIFIKVRCVVYFPINLLGKAGSREFAADISDPYHLIYQRHCGKTATAVLGCPIDHSKHSTQGQWQILHIY